MNGTKCIFFMNLAKKRNYSYLRFDCSGHGQSSGIFEELSINDWYQDLNNVLSLLKINKDIIMIGSSMGGWIACYYALNHPKQIIKLIGLAPAPDFTERLVWPSFSKKEKLKIENKENIKRRINKNYFYIYSHKLIFNSRECLIGNLRKKYDGEVIFFHGSKDRSVPYNYNDNLLHSKQFKNIQLILIKDEDHSLSTRKTLRLISNFI